MSWSFGAATEGDAVQDKGAGVVGKFLVSVVTFFSDDSDSFEMTKAECSNAQKRQRRPDRREGGADG